MERNSQRLVIALASALGLALLAVAYLLGRVSATPAAVTAAAPARDLAPSQSASAPPEIPATLPPASLEFGASPLPVPEPVVYPPAGREADPISPPASGPASGGPLSPPSPDRPQIAAYFNQIDRLEDMGGGDPQTFANSIVQSMSSGDFSGFDDLLAKARTQRQRLQSIAPPRACVEHHRLALALSTDSVAMLERLKAALVKGDTTGLLTVAAEGRTLETQANQLKAMGEAIRRQAGL